MNKEILEILRGIKKDLDIIASDKEAEKKSIDLNPNMLQLTKNIISEIKSEQENLANVKVSVSDSEKGSLKSVEPQKLIQYLCANIDNLVTEIDIKKKVD